MKNIGKIKVLPIREQVASILRKAILTGDLEEGRELTLDEIATQVGVSSMPVREAFQILATDGLIKLRHNKAAVVLGISEKNIKDHYHTRALLESDCCALASAEGKDISPIVEAYELSKQAVENGEYSKYSELNQGFHMAIWEVADNSKIESILSTIWNGLSTGFKVSEEEYAKMSIKEHEVILEFIKSGNSDEARKAMNEHIMRSMKDILTNLDRSK